MHRGHYSLQKCHHISQRKALPLSKGLSRDRAALRRSSSNLSCAITPLKCNYTRKIQCHNPNIKASHSLWQEIQALTQFKPAPSSSDGTLPEEPATDVKTAGNIIGAALSITTRHLPQALPFHTAPI